MPRAYSLRSRLLLIIVLAIAPALVLTLIGAVEGRRRAAADVAREVLSVMEIISSDQANTIARAREMVVTLSHLRDVRGDNLAGCYDRLAELIPLYPDYTSFGVTDAAGNVVCSSSPGLASTNVAGEMWFQRVLARHDFAAGNYKVGPASDEPVVEFAYPILRNGELFRVVYGVIQFDTMAYMAQTIGLPDGGVLLLIDSHGKIAGRHPTGADWVGQSLPEAPLVRQVLAQPRGVAELPGLDGQLRLFAWIPLVSPNAADMYLAAGFPLQTVYAGTDALYARNLALLGITALLALAAAWIAADTLVVRQVHALVHTAQRLQAGDLSARPPTGRITASAAAEVGELARAFSEMAAALEQRAAEQQQAEAALAAERERLRVSRDELAAILHGVAEGISVQAANGDIVYANDGAVEIAGQASAALLGAEAAGSQPGPEVTDEIGSPVPPEQRPGQRALAGQPARAVVRVAQPNGDERWVDWQARPILDAAGQVLMAVNILHDVTEIKKTERHQRLLAEASHVLASSLNYHDRMGRLARLLVPAMADWCTVDTWEPGQPPTLVAAAHADPEKEALIYTLRRHYPPPADYPVRRALESGRAEIVTDITAADLASRTQDEGHRRLLSTLGIHARLVLPLVARGRTLGALSLFLARPGRQYTPAGVRLAEDVAARAALALDNARLYAQATALNTQLELRVAERTVELERSREQLRLLSAHLTNTREAERRRIAHEIHDELGGAMTGIKMELAQAARLVPPEAAGLRERLASLGSTVDGTLQFVRRLATELRPSILDDFGLGAAIEWQASEFQRRTGIVCELAAAPPEVDLPPDSATALFRIFQETLTNVARHSGATRVTVSLEVHNGQLRLRVQDNGRGIKDVEQGGAGSLGLVGMRERVRLINGRLDIRGEPGQGTAVIVDVPLGRGAP